MCVGVCACEREVCVRQAVLHPSWFLSHSGWAMNATGECAGRVSVCVCVCTCMCDDIVCVYVHVHVRVFTRVLHEQTITFV